MEEKLIKKDEIIMGLLVPRANTYTIPLTELGRSRPSSIGG